MIIPTSFAIVLAVMTLSPVTILTLIPAFLHLAIAPGTSGLKTSLTPNTANKMSFDFST
jgi:hypothetical protein